MILHDRASPWWAAMILPICSSLWCPGVSLHYVCTMLLITTYDAIWYLHHLLDNHMWCHTRSSWSPRSWYVMAHSGSSPWCPYIMPHCVDLLNLSTVDGSIINLYYLLCNHMCCSTMSSKSSWRTYVMLYYTSCSWLLRMILYYVYVFLLITWSGMTLMCASTPWSPHMMPQYIHVISLVTVLAIILFCWWFILIIHFISSLSLFSKLS